MDWCIREGRDLGIARDRVSQAGGCRTVSCARGLHGVVIGCQGFSVLRARPTNNPERLVSLIINFSVPRSHRFHRRRRRNRTSTAEVRAPDRKSQSRSLLIRERERGGEGNRVLRWGSKLSLCVLGERNARGYREITNEWMQTRNVGGVGSPGKSANRSHKSAWASTLPLASPSLSHLLCTSFAEYALLIATWMISRCRYNTYNIMRQVTRLYHWYLSVLKCYRTKVLYIFIIY